MSSIAYKQPDF